MRHVKKKFRPQPKALKECNKKLREQLLSGDVQIKSTCYQKAKADLEKLYYGKCAYCESHNRGTSYVQVEHYRPKSLYWWLIFEWSNLLPACQVCNTNKRNQFPIQGKKQVVEPSLNGRGWIANSKKLMAEAPQLLHPEVDEPNDHIEYLPDGKIRAKRGSLKGLTTIQICCLDRDGLVTNYKMQIDGIFNAIRDKTLILAFMQSKKKLTKDRKLELYSTLYLADFRKLLRLQAPENPEAFTQLGYHMYVGFEDFIIARLPENDDLKGMVREAFRYFQEGKLKEWSRK